MGMGHSIEINLAFDWSQQVTYEEQTTEPCLSNSTKLLRSTTATLSEVGHLLAWELDRSSMEPRNPNNTISQSITEAFNGDSSFPTIVPPTIEVQEDPIVEVTVGVSNNEGIPSTNDFAIDDDSTSEDLDSNADEQTPVNDKVGCSGLNELVEVVNHVVEPKVGMTFGTAKEAYDYYNEYARECGFSVRILRTNTGRTDRSKIHRQALVCSREGSYKRTRTPRRRRESRRFECKAIFEVKLVDGDKYRLINFISEHSHDLVPPLCSYYSRSQRKTEFPQVDIVSKMQSSGVNQSETYSYQCEEVGGAQHPSFQRSDSNSTVQSFKRGDAQFLLDFFKRKGEEKKHFFDSIRINDDGKIHGAFFCDAKSRRDYGLFGDVVCFDTTCRTNNYDMVCVPIFGINNHGQITLFGCGLLDGETTDAMVWLFTTFLEAMGGKKPISIYTDQSMAISNAISVVYPESHHGLCLWHICQNAKKHLSKVCGTFKSFALQFKACLYDPKTIEEFEQCWDNLLEDHGLRGNEWLRELYELRTKWAQVYSHAHFCAGMTTPQRSESMCKFLKAYFCSGSTVLRVFVDQYYKAMADLHEKEREAEYRTIQTTPNLISGWSVEREATKIYTREMFYCFQEGLQQTIDLLLELEKDDGTIRTYKATEMEGKKKIHTVTYNHSEQSVLCTCRTFEFNGILCSHALKLFRGLQYTSLPPEYYLKRWSQIVRDEDVFDPYGDVIPNDNDPLATTHYNELLLIAKRIMTKASKSKDAFSLAMSVMLDLEDRLRHV